jgi:hypothetical protein
MKAREQQKRTLEDRIRAIEDQLEIYNLIAGHPPSADTGGDGYTRAVYAEDGVLDLGRDQPVRGNETIAAITRTPAHQAAIAGGLAHVVGLPHVEIDGDSAVAISYLQILMPDPNGASVELSNHGVSKGFRIHRVSANCWEFARTGTGWKVKRRTLRTIDGSASARDILRRALEGYPTASAAGTRVT